MRTPDPDQPFVTGEPAPYPAPPTVEAPTHTEQPVAPALPDELAHTGVELSLLPAVLLIAVGAATFQAGRARRRK